MKLQPCCVECLREKEQERALQIKNLKQREEYLQKVEAILRDKKDMTPPEYLDAFYQLFNGSYGSLPSYKELKEKFNQLMLEKEPWIYDRIQNSKDSLKTAIQAAQAGNYIDCIAMKEIKEEILEKLLSDFEHSRFDKMVYDAFQTDIKKASKLLYFTDNCGEIVLDKLLIRILRKYNSKMEVTAVVRGKEVGNDAVLEDAVQVGLDQEAVVIGNGTSIAGSCVHLMPEDIQKKFEEADMIISKGQANYETLSGCGKNVYYLFLCKCPLFMEEFCTEYLEPIFCRESTKGKEETVHES